jgi:NAD-dependent SIR2 family protein deacetylase
MIERGHGAFRVRALAKNMEYRRQQGERPYLLVLGAGASLSSGASSGSWVITEVTETHGSKPVDGMTWDQRVEEFYDILDHRSRDERYAILKQHISGKAPSEGYRALAELIQGGYFEEILSTNYDTFLEDALSAAGLRRGDFDLLINGVHDEDEMLLQLGRPIPAVKVIKLHGDLQSRLFAFTPEEIFQFSQKIENVLRDLLRRDLAICGHSMRDNDINRCIEQDGGSVWYVGPSEPGASEPIYQILRVRSGQIISGEMGYFDRFFVALRDALPRNGE